MSPVRVRVLGAALLLPLAAITACGGPSHVAPVDTPQPSTPRTTQSVQADAGAVFYEISGPPGSKVRISWGIGSTTGHTEHSVPWSHTEVAPMTPFSVTLQGTLATFSGAKVTCRITMEGREVASKTESGGALCAAMNLNRANRLGTPTP